MRLAIVAALCALFATSGVARADLEKGAWAPGIEAREWLNTDTGAPVTLPELRGMTVILFFWVSYEKGAEYVLPLMNLLNSKIGRSRGVYMIGLTDSDRKRVEPLLKKELVFFPVGLESKSYQEYKITEFPRVVVIDANGKIAYSGWPTSGGEESMVKAVFESIAETPPTKTHPLDAVLIERELRDARQALSEDRIRDAYKAAKQAHEKALTGDALKTRCHEYLELVEALGRDQLAQAMRAVEEKDFTVAVELLTDTMREFKDMDVATSARRKLESLKKKYEEVARVISQESEASQAERLLAQAIEALRAQPRRIGEAYEKLEQIVNDFAATPAASRAQTVLDRMKENVGVMAYVGDHKTQPECERLLSQARSFEQVGRTSDAKRLYRQIIDQYGETIWADEAARRLAQLP